MKGQSQSPMARAHDFLVPFLISYIVIFERRPLYYRAPADDTPMNTKRQLLKDATMKVRDGKSEDHSPGV